MSKAAGEEEVLIDHVKDVAGIILGVSDNRAWIVLFFDGDAMHTKSVDLPFQAIFDIYVEGIPHKATVYEHPRTMIFFDGPCDLEIIRDGEKVIIKGAEIKQRENVT